jgi:hypothetical protein
MYPNIPTDEGIRRIATLLEAPLMEFSNFLEAERLIIRGRKELVVLLLRFVLKYNYVHFGDKMFQQVVGTAMGTACTPTYANLFLASFEGPALDELKDIILFYGRFINDTFAIIKGTLEDVGKFQRHFVSLHPK